MESFHNLNDYFYRPTKGGASSLWHGEPLVKFGRCVEGGERQSALINRDLVKRRDKLHQGENAPFPRESKTSSPRGMESCPRQMMKLSLLELNGLSWIENGIYLFDEDEVNV